MLKIHNNSQISIGFYSGLTILVVLLINTSITNETLPSARGPLVTTSGTQLLLPGDWTNRAQVSSRHLATERENNFWELSLLPVGVRGGW